MDVIDLLLNAKPFEVPEKEYKLRRLSKDCGGDVVFKLRAVSFERVAEIRRINESEQNVHIILAGTVSPDLKNKSLLEKYGAETPAELIKVLLLPGEIDDVAMRIEKLSGFKSVVTEEVKKN